MDCKHLIIKGNTYYCRAKDKAINTYNCRGCMLKISSLPKTFEEVFGRGFGGNK